ncbi:helix-turn-helix domain-containing protein [Parasphingorhabdus sp.]|jgi:DNA-binding CsgD family transcriptional regulator|uniref:helix-turn-helix transcriptional regulator n=1 Tax=Parasphingorhabdus sp. TaxID=2709688 RepID=UPI0009EE1DE0
MGRMIAAGDQHEDISELEHMLEKVSIHSASDIRSAAINFSHFAEVRNLRIALCADIANGKPMTDMDGTSLNADIFGWVESKERWWEDARYALHSPIPRACRYEGEPFWCDKRGFHGKNANPFLDEIDLTAYFEKVAKNYRQLIIVPVHLPFGQISANSFPYKGPETDDFGSIFSSTSVVLAALTRRFISGYVAVASKSNIIPSDCGLSKREAECIKWASIGKTDEEIGTIMSVCRSTVRYHVKRAGEKLGSVNRTQTVFKAAQLGYLGASRW